MPFATQGGGGLNTSVVALNASTPTAVLNARGTSGPPFRVGFILQNQSAIDIYVGGPNVTTSGGTQGYLLKGGLTPPSTFTDTTINGAVYAIAASATPSLNVVEIY